MATICNKRKIRVMVGDVESSITAVPAKSQAITDLIYEVGGCAICTGSFTLSAEQFAEFAKRSTGILKS